MVVQGQEGWSARVEADSELLLYCVAWLCARHMPQHTPSFILRPFILGQDKTPLSGWTYLPRFADDLRTCLASGLILLSRGDKTGCQRFLMLFF